MHTYSDGTDTWNVEDLWKATNGLESNPMLLRDIADIDNLLDSHCWSAGPMTVREIIDHAQRIESADLNLPIILTPTGAIADGVHRLVKALLRNQKHLHVIRLLEMPPPMEKKDA